MVERGFPVFLFAPPGKTLGDMAQLGERLSGLGAETVVLSRDARLLARATSPIRMPRSMPEVLTAIPYIIPAQLFAAHLADVKGINPDAPRSLSKVTRTV